jgi:hypothetical protein
METLRLVAMIVSTASTHHGDNVVGKCPVAIVCGRDPSVERGGSDWKSKMDGRAAS